MARVQLLLCFTVILASVALLDVVSATLKYKPALPKIEDPKTVKDVEGYTVKVVMVFVTDLEKECPKDSKFKTFFERLRAYAKYVCPIKKDAEKDYDRDMKAKAGSLLQAISSFAVGKIKAEIQEEKAEALETFNKLKSVAAKIMGGRKKEESEDSTKLTAAQLKEIKEGILSWETVITKIATTMVQSTTTSSSSTSEKESASSSNKSSGSKSSDKKTSGSKSSDSKASSYSTGTSFSDTTGSGSYMGTPSGSPSNSPSSSTYASAGGSPANSPSTSTSASAGGSPASGPSASTYAAAGGSGISYSDTTGGSYTSPAGSPTSTSPAAGPTSSASGPTSSASGSTSSASSASAATVAEVEAETSKEVMTFIMNLEKKCPPKEEYKSFFEKLKATMTASAKVTVEKKKGFFSGLKSAAGKVSEGMSFITSRIGSKSSEVKQSMETYHKEVVKALEELDTIHGKIISENKGKQDGSVTVTATQRTEIKQTITKWEQVTTQFVETAMKSEASTNTTAGIDKVKLN